MLNTIDTLIAFVVVMLVVSMAVTTLTGMIGSMFNLRGVCLRQGVARLLHLLDRDLDMKKAKVIAGHLLRDPLVARPMSVLPGSRLADTVHREELTKLILKFASRHVPAKVETNTEPAADAESNAEPQEAADSAADNAQGGGITVVQPAIRAWPSLLIWNARQDLNALRGEVMKAVDKGGISNPEEMLERVRNAALELEQASPELSAAVRQNVALLNVAQSDFLAKINGWFDQTIDRVSDLFTARTRLVTAAAALVMALLLQLDAIALLNRVHDDPAARAELVQEAIRNPDKFKPADAPNASTWGATTAVTMVLDSPGIKGLAQQDLITVPATWQEWIEGSGAKEAKDAKGAWLLRHILGILISAALLSLGAPFWYSALQNLLRLRSIVATRDDAQRNERQTTQEPAAAASAVAPPALVGSERGNLEAVG